MTFSPLNDVGYQSITVPGSLKAYREAQTEFGTMPWAAVLEPAIEHAEAGFVVRPMSTASEPSRTRWAAWTPSSAERMLREMDMGLWLEQAEAEFRASSGRSPETAHRGHAIVGGR